MNLLLSFLLASSVVHPERSRGTYFFLLSSRTRSRRLRTVVRDLLLSQVHASYVAAPGLSGAFSEGVIPNRSRPLFLARVFVRGQRREGPAFSSCHPESARAVCERCEGSAFPLGNLLLCFLFSLLPHPVIPNPKRDLLLPSPNVAAADCRGRLCGFPGAARSEHPSFVAASSPRHPDVIPSLPAAGRRSRGTCFSPPVIPNRLAPFASGVRDLLFSWGICFFLFSFRCCLTLSSRTQRGTCFSPSPT
jgi:hypothetical protein